MSTSIADPVVVSSPASQSNASTPKHILRTHSTQASGSHSLAPPSNHLQIQAERKEDQDSSFAVRGRQNTVAMNGIDKHNHSPSNTPSPGQGQSSNDNTMSNSSPAAHLPHAVNGVSSRVSPLGDTEAVDQFDTYKDFSPSPRSQVSSNNHNSSSHQQHHYALSTSQSFYASSTQLIPDIISNIDRSLLSIIAPFNFLDPQTLATRMAAVDITKASYLLKRQSHPMLGGTRYRYNKRYVLLKDNQLRYDSSKKDNPLKGGMDLRYVTVERGDDSDVFWLEVSEWWKHNGKYEKTKMEHRVIEWRCETELQREEWVQAIQESKMMHEVYPLNKGEDITPFPVALVLGLPQAGRSTIFKHLMAWRPPSINPTEQEGLPKSSSFSSFSPRIGEQTTHTKASHHHRYTDVPQEAEGFMPIETRLSWKKRIFLHTLSGLCTLGEAIDEHTVDSSFVYAKTVLEDERTKITANDDENITLDRHCIEYIHRVWNEPQVQQLYQSNFTITQPTVLTLNHFIDQIDRMSESDWIPSFMDVIYCYHPSQIMTWKQIDPHTTHRFRVYDIGAAYPMDRVEKWKLERFCKATLIVFVVNVCGYDRPSTVDPHVSMLQESLLLYQQLLQNELFEQWGPILVYFTHADLLREQLLLTPFKDKVHGYEGSGDKNSVLRCMMGMFAKVGGTRYQGRVVCAIDRPEMKKIIAEDIERRRELLRKNKERAAQR